MADISQDRIVRKEVALGSIREFTPPENHIGLSLLAPMREVESDDVIFDYTQGLVTGLAPARAEDAESELAQKDETVGYGRAAIIDWALKDHYDPSDVSRYRELTQLGSLTQGSFPLTIGRMTEGFEAKVARDARLRRRKLDNRMEWLIMQALETGAIAYNDGRIKFTVDYGRPGAQTDDDLGAGSYWNETTSDPIGDILSRQQVALDTYGVNLDRAIISKRILNAAMNSEKFTNLLIGANPLYTVSGWGPQAALDTISRATGVDFILYDSVYRTKDGSGNPVNNRFLSDNKIYMLPSTADVDEIDDTIGFGATLTSPHPEGNWQPGFYEWERETVDPWGRDIGTGIKAFPVFPHLEYTWTVIALAP